METIGIFIVLAIVYFLFIHPHVNPKTESKHLRTCGFKYMSIFVLHSERNPTMGSTQVVFFEDKIVFQ
ncbi:hypothetical protein GGR21_003810 [Dysgonomonas hofstadii]|uniref:Uncharacterized protein n=1 Tax=Dysgonomonas hofstadii TaxID=637886 RepID=A0A840CT73_9BACT|nr:hypothetical protein [Dysgonomonas hofstadii]